MKKYILCTLAALLMLTFMPTSIQAATTPVSPLPAAPERIVLVSRLNEINTMDQSTLSVTEQDQLNREQKSIESTLNNGYGGVYISVGALLIIILILIILL